jgi:hypothetical protein
MNEHVDRLRRWAEGLAESAGGDPRDMPQWEAADALERAEAEAARYREALEWYLADDRRSVDCGILAKVQDRPAFYALNPPPDKRA